MNTAKRIIVRRINKWHRENRVNASSTGLKKSQWKSVVGLEVHAQIAANSKLFSGSGTSFAAPLNASVSLFDAAVPGTLPVLNKACVELGVKTALALDCTINPISMFDRKHYFYADLPAGYQITQQRAPLANNGKLKFPVLVPGIAKKPYYKSVRLHQLQLEQDSGKSLHDDSAGRSLVDLNRAGIPLMELVFEPDLEDGEEAASLIKELILILKCIGSCSCRMEEGALRVDANVSLHKPNTPLGTRTEIKNIGSVRNVAQAIAYEIERQRKLLDANKTITNETRAWDAATKTTIAMRDKEVQQDYRFMPEPNLPPLHLAVGDSSDGHIDLINVRDVKKTIPELPEAKRNGLAEEFKLPQEIAIILVNEQILLNYFNTIMANNRDIEAKSVANFLINDLLAFCNKGNIAVEDCKITCEQFIKLFELLKSQVISFHFARMLLEEMHTNPDKSPSEIVEEKNWKQINDMDEIESFCKDCIANNAKTVEQYLKGKEKVFYALVGEVVKKSEQRANTALVVEKLKELLNARR